MWWDSTHLSFSGYNSQIKFSPLNCTKDFIYGTKQMILLYNDLYNRWFVIQTGWRSIKITSFLLFHIWLMITIYIFQFSLVAQSCSILCNPMDCSMSGLPVHHQLPEFTQTHIHRVDDAIQPSHPLSSPSPHAFKLSQNQGLSNESVLCIRWPKYWSFIFTINPSNKYSGLISLGWTGWISLQSKGLSRVSSSITVQKHQFFGAQLSL